MEIGIFGFGQFGRFIAGILSKDCHVCVYDNHSRAELAARIGVKLVDMDTLLRQKVIILSIPISKTEKLLKDIAPSLKTGQLVVDVCSVKVLPSEWMVKYLPEDVEILATHPLFGPQSALENKGIKGFKMVLCPVRIDPGKFKIIRDYLRKRRLKVFEMTPDEHDIIMAQTQCISHFIGRALHDYGVKQQDITTPSYERLFSVVGQVSEDTTQLFKDMNKYNPHARTMRKKLLRSFMELDDRLNNEK